MSVFDRFRKLERPRRESAEAAPPPAKSLERFRPQTADLGLEPEDDADAEKEREPERQRRVRTAPPPASTAPGAAGLDWSRPLIAVLQSTRVIEPYAVRLAIQIALVVGFVAALFWSIRDMRRYPLLVLLLLLVGVSPGWRGRRRWWR